MIGIIGGTSFLDSDLFRDWPTKRLDTSYGSVSVMVHEKAVFLQRHGDPPLPPHKINHRANIRAMKILGAANIIAVNSVGSLKIKNRPGTFVVPDDFISIWQIPTFFDDEMQFMVPRMDVDLAEWLYRRCKVLKMDVQRGGVYIQTAGPRLETRAEIAMLKRSGDIVGMTMASEATLSMEQQIPYASLCSIDNYGHGIAKAALTMEEIKENVMANTERVEALIRTIIAGDLP
ncbi:MTAP family purine nucleoside phosphorylase [Syntrophorhabdus aromaticivorans]|uniref:MTAP family purine nucleoside phosphorylase n=1 Tax=Syntrophorhabdus aromaticivorans TaxID=328301 RepID=A0A971S2C4_9BACT|nr:MTAP family purine nucleoside phosphorylase [Syntrophorhabdus aromaticivorans]NLW36796.1 MTAP family purine nucleoside phosphorylase [Syntrophorhabdus aromaticivorans]